MDFSAIVEATSAIKATFDAIRAAISAMKDAADLLPEGEKKAAALQALAEAEKAARINEAQIAGTLGYELCRCEFPPHIMLKVGTVGRGMDTGKPVYECPVCKQNTAAPYNFVRARDLG